MRVAAASLLILAAAAPLPGEDFLNDPSLGGKLRFTYRARYDARFYRFHGYRFNFPVSPTDPDRDLILAAARELEEAHRGNRDQDVDQYIAIKTHDLITPWIDSGYYQGLDTEFSARYFKDIDGTPPGNDSLDIRDTFPGREDFQLRTLNARVRLLDEHLEITVGRQYIEAAEWVHIDGGAVRLIGLEGPFEKPLEVQVFGGQRVSFYSSIQEEDLFKNDVWGATVIYRPSRDTRIEVSDVHYIDNSLRVWIDQRITPLVDVDLVYRQINEDPESVRVDGFFRHGELDLELRLGYFLRFGGDIDDFNFDYTFSDRVPSSDSDHDRHLNIGDLEAFHEVSLEGRIGLSEFHGVFAGAIGHWLDDRSDRDVYNTDWYELWAGVDTLHVPWEGLTGRLTVRSVLTDLPRRRFRDPSDPLFIADTVGDGEPSFLGVEMLLEQDFARRFSLGTSLEWRLYEYESRYADLDNLHALSVTAFARWRQNSILTYHLDYTYERDYRFVNPDFDEVHGVRAQVVVSW